MQTAPVPVTVTINIKKRPPERVVLIFISIVYSGLAAPVGQTPAQEPQSMHAFSSIS